MGRQHILEPAAQEIADATSRLPPVDKLGPEGLRKALDDIQAAPIAAHEVDERWITVAAEVGEVRVRIVKPVGSAALVIVDENDVLRDEGEAYARRLTEAGVRTASVRYNGTIHEFMLLNPLRGTAAATAAIEQAIQVLRQAFATRS